MSFQYKKLDKGTVMQIEKELMHDRLLVSITCLKNILKTSHSNYL